MAVNQDLYIFILQSILCHMLTSLLILIRNIYEIGIYDFSAFLFTLDTLDRIQISERPS